MPIPPNLPPEIQNLLHAHKKNTHTHQRCVLEPVCAHYRDFFAKGWEKKDEIFGRAYDSWTPTSRYLGLSGRLATRPDRRSGSAVASRSTRAFLFLACRRNADWGKVNPEKKQRIDRSTQETTAPSAKQLGPTGEGLTAAVAASLTAAERWWSWSSSSLRLFASTCLRRCSSYDSASATSFRCAAFLAIPISLGFVWEQNGMGRGEAEEARRRSREKGAVPRKGTGAFVHSVHEPVAPGPFVSGIGTVISWTRCMDLVHSSRRRTAPDSKFELGGRGWLCGGFSRKWVGARAEFRSGPTCLPVLLAVL